MKTILKINFWLLLIVLFCSCEKALELNEPRFNVQDYEIREVYDEEGNLKRQVTFSLEGNADIISFYSGEIGGNYAFRDGRILELLGLGVSFSSNCTFGEQGPETFSVLASVDFNGNFEPEDVQEATWIDITDRFVISPLESTNAVYHASGTGDITDLTAEGKPIYLAMRHITQDQTASGIYSAMRIRDWLVTSETDLGTTVLANQGDAGWALVEVGNFRPGRNSIGSATITLRGNHGNTTDHLEFLQATTEGWVISQPIQVGDVDMGPDRPIPVKSREDLPLQTFVYEYTEPGTYEAVFMASNVNIEDGKKVYKSIDIVIPE